MKPEQQLVEMTDKRRERLVKLRDKTGYKFRGLFENNTSAPQGLDFSLADNLLREKQRLKTVRRDYLAFMYRYMRNFDDKTHKQNKKRKLREPETFEDGKIAESTQAENQRFKKHGLKKLTHEDVTKIQNLAAQAGLGAQRIHNRAKLETLSMGNVHQLLGGHIPSLPISRKDLARIYQTLRHIGMDARVALDTEKRKSRLAAITQSPSFSYTEKGYKVLDIHTKPKKGIYAGLLQAMNSPPNGFTTENIRSICCGIQNSATRKELSEIFKAARKLGLPVSGKAHKIWQKQMAAVDAATALLRAEFSLEA